MNTWNWKHQHIRFRYRPVWTLRQGQWEVKKEILRLQRHAVEEPLRREIEDRCLETWDLSKAPLRIFWRQKKWQTWWRKLMNIKLERKKNKFIDWFAMNFCVQNPTKGFVLDLAKTRDLWIRSISKNWIVISIIWKIVFFLINQIIRIS